MWPHWSPPGVWLAYWLPMLQLSPFSSNKPFWTQAYWVRIRWFRTRGLSGLPWQTVWNDLLHSLAHQNPSQRLFSPLLHNILFPGARSIGIPATLRSWAHPLLLLLRVGLFPLKHHDDFHHRLQRSRRQPAIKELAQHLVRPWRAGGLRHPALHLLPAQTVSPALEHLLRHLFGSLFDMFLHHACLHRGNFFPLQLFRPGLWVPRLTKVFSEDSCSCTMAARFVYAFIHLLWNSNLDSSLSLQSGLWRCFADHINHVPHFRAHWKRAFCCYDHLEHLLSVVCLYDAIRRRRYFHGDFVFGDLRRGHTPLLPAPGRLWNILRWTLQQHDGDRNEIVGGTWKIQPHFSSQQLVPASLQLPTDDLDRFLDETERERFRLCYSGDRSAWAGSVLNS